ncbi:MAG: hypothetical protein R3C68_10160 [Myxococcota bacterium]
MTAQDIFPAYLKKAIIQENIQFLPEKHQRIHTNSISYILRMRYCQLNYNMTPYVFDDILISELIRQKKYTTLKEHIQSWARKCPQVFPVLSIPNTRRIYPSTTAVILPPRRVIKGGTLATRADD